MSKKLGRPHRAAFGTARRGSIADQLDRHRAAARIPVSALAERSGIAESHCRAVLSGDRPNPGLATISAMAATLGYDLVLSPRGEPR